MLLVPVEHLARSQNDPMVSKKVVRSPRKVAVQGYSSLFLFFWRSTDEHESVS